MSHGMCHLQSVVPQWRQAVVLFDPIQSSGRSLDLIFYSQNPGPSRTGFESHPCEGVGSEALLRVVGPVVLSFFTKETALSEPV